jgi:hypothetical protein
MSRRDVASSSRIETKGAIQIRVVRLARKRTEGRQSQSSETEIQLNSNDAACRASELTRNGTNLIDGGGGREPTQGGTPLTPKARRRVQGN